MEVKDQLPPAALAIGNQAETLFGKTKVPGDLHRRLVELPNKHSVSWLHGEKSTDVFLGDEKNVHRGYRIDVVES
jgi:hypothetical protein